MQSTQMSLSTRKILSSIQVYLHREELTFCVYSVYCTLLITCSLIDGSTVRKLYTRTILSEHKKMYKFCIQITSYWVKLKLNNNNKVHQLHSNRQCTLTGHTFASWNETHMAKQSECDTTVWYKFPRINTALIIDTSNPWWKRPGRWRSEGYLVTCWP
jgi:hypothetical protein